MEYCLHPTVLYGVTAYLPTLCMTSPDESSKIGMSVCMTVQEDGPFHRAPTAGDGRGLIHAPLADERGVKLHIR